jgi:hypothetical protein
MILYYLLILMAIDDNDKRRLELIQIRLSLTTHAKKGSPYQIS